jgi:hypothetical protein
MPWRMARRVHVMTQIGKRECRVRDAGDNHLGETIPIDKCAKRCFVPLL